MAHQTPKPIIANCVPKLVAMATSVSTAGPPSNTTHTVDHNPNGIWFGSAVFAQMTAEYSYALQYGAPFPLKFAPSHGGICTLI